MGVVIRATRKTAREYAWEGFAVSCVYDPLYASGK